jgi:ABC-type phosphate transport system substrate-binding protein
MTAARLLLALLGLAGAATAMAAPAAAWTAEPEPLLIAGSSTVAPFAQVVAA